MTDSAGHDPHASSDSASGGGDSADRASENDPTSPGGRQADEMDSSADAPDGARVSPNVRVGARPSYLAFKTWLDRYLATVAIVAFAPLMAFLVYRIRRDSRGPALFTQTRAGRDGHGFTLYKFRTMRTDADPFGDSPETGEDPRITPIGRFLRESSLDELPQLINVARGEMSVVGPRPLFVQQIPEWNARHKNRLLVHPGLTGFAQIRGRASIPLEEKLELDVRYVESVSLRTDLLVIWQTLHSVRNKEGLYQTQYSLERATFK